MKKRFLKIIIVICAIPIGLLCFIFAPPIWLITGKDILTKHISLVIDILEGL